MKRCNNVFMTFGFILLAVFFASNLHAEVEVSKPYKEEVIQKVQKLQAPFIANDGQTDERVKFYANTFGGTVFVTRDGEIVYSLPAGRGEEAGDGKQGRRGAEGQGGKGVAIKEHLIGGKIGEIRGEAQSVTKVSYFKGNDPSRWKTNVSTYDYVNLGEIYKGIELKLKAYGDNVEKLFCVKPGADPEQIKISLNGLQPPDSPFIKGEYRRPGGDVSTESPLEKGARGLWVNEGGQLVVETELGPVKYTKPIAYQEIDGKRMEVDVEYRLSNPKSEISNPKSEYGFTVSSYDKTKDLIIDPLLASTFLGGSDQDYGYSIAIDGGGDVYVTGFTWSANFPTTAGAYDTSFNGGLFDVFVSKFNSGLTSLLASTFLGAYASEEGYSIAIDGGGNVYVTGLTRSVNFPTTTDAYDTSYNGGTSDVFVSKFNSGLTSLLSSTFLGGSDQDYGYSIAIDGGGNVYVTGFTWSANFPTTTGAYDTSFNGGYFDVFVSKFNSDLTSLLSSTFLGGSGPEEGDSIAIDGGGNVYVTGLTKSENFPTTTGAYDTSHNGGIEDVFVSKFNSGLTSLLSSTFLGGSSIDYGFSIAIDGGGDVYVTGFTWSANFPTTAGAYDTSFNGGNDVFVSKFNSGLTSLLASTFLGEYASEEGYSIAIDGGGNVYVTGLTRSVNFPTTTDAYDTSYNGGTSDVFVSKFNSGLTSLLSSTFLGGSGDEEGHSIAIGGGGNVYVTGQSGSTDFPTTTGAYDTSQNDSWDVFVSKLDGNLSAGCDGEVKTVETDTGDFELLKLASKVVTVTVTDGGGCPVADVKVSAKIKGVGKKRIGISQSSKTTDENGKAAFTITAKEKTGKAKATFKAGCVKKLIIVTVK